ncbi:MAG: AI-2E family transporter [Bacteroidota bacterium]
MKLKLAGRPFYIKLACTLFSLIALGFLVIEGKRILSPIIFACLFSILLLPLANFLERKFHFRRNMAALTSVLIMVVCLGAILYLLGTQIARLVGDWPVFKEELASAGNELQSWVSQQFHIDVDKQVSYVHKATSKIVDSGTVMAGATLYSVSTVLLFFSFTLFYSFFFLLYRSLIIKFLMRVFLEENNKLVKEIIQEVQFIIRKYITGLLIEMAIVSTLVSVVLSILGIKYAVLLGLITGLLNIIPYIGILSALIISALITFATTAAATKVIWIVAVLFGTHLIDVNILLPVIVGSKVRINAMITLLGIIVGEMVWGIAGMFLSIPVIAVLKIIFDRVEALRPWGLLLGEEERAYKPFRLKRKRASLEEKISDGE